ncbi:MAG: cupin domain-containing protein, partial [Pseudomonadota bacterium]|nr:cupin domain-containing protein [Pseudomonadota bacterium]
MLKPNVDKAEFLKDYWQKKPILIKNFFSNFENYTNPEELLEIACIDTVDSRIVTTRPEYCVAERYSLTQGPFDADSPLPALTEKNWSLLVQSAELWIPDLQEMIRAFGFLPRWR